MKKRSAATIPRALLGSVLLILSFLMALITGDIHLFTFVLLSTFGAWIEIPLEPQGSIDLSVVVSLVALLILGWKGIIVGFLGPLLGYLLLNAFSWNRLPQYEAIIRSSELLLALSCGTIFGEFLLLFTRVKEVSNFLTAIVSVGFFLVIRACRISFADRINPIRVIVAFGRSAVPHLMIFLMIVLAVLWMNSAIGSVAVFLMLLAIFEMYYPWKLLGEERGLFFASLQMISNAVDLKDPYTANHSRRVARSAVAMARAMGIPEDQVERIRIGALMHDIGKIGVPAGIIRKPAALTSDEMEIMRGHAKLSEEIIGDLDILRDSVSVVRSHHEHFDGGGYPEGLSGQEIPIGSRIILVADAFDALTTDRPYRKAKSLQETLMVLEANSGSQFDPQVVRILNELIRRRSISHGAVSQTTQ